MNLQFEEVIATFLANEIGITTNFISPQLAQNLIDNLIKFHSENKLFDAGIGVKTDFHLDNLYRKDKILWLNKSVFNIFEMAFFEVIDAFVLYLNKTCFAGITNYEFHYALYEKGSFYKKHIDQFSTNSHRAYSVIIYLNPFWKIGDGGELIIFKENSTETISPILGKMVFFDSANLPHEVLETNEKRMSITGWLKRN